MVKEANVRGLDAGVFIFHSYLAATIVLLPFSLGDGVSLYDVVVGVAAGLLVSFASVSAYRAVGLLGGITVFPLVNLSYLLSLLYGVLLLGENVKPVNIVGLPFAAVSLLLLAERPSRITGRGLLYLGTAFLGYGFTDIVLKTYYRMAGEPHSMTLSLVIDLTVTLHLALSSPGRGLGRVSWLALLNGLLLAVSTISLVKALSSGPVSLVSPIAKLNTVIPVVYSMARGETYDSETVLSALLAVTAVLLLSI